ncbi:sensor histidine kinase [Haloplanus litoreus]|uniref:sensor histidine kinase n=1 Tax=Haloplanus litoreus TaxID=767515 RepID=UPI003612AC55
MLARVLRHDIRNKLGVVQGNAETVRSETTDDEIAAMATRIEDASQQLLARADKQRSIVRLLVEPSTEVPLSLSDSVTDVVERLKGTYPEAAITVDVPSGLTVTTIPELRRAIEEVVENAIVHADRRPEITVDARTKDGAVELRIEDDGPGIPAAERQVIGERTEIDALRHSNGMGLWLVDHIVAEAGGTVRFADADPRGASSPSSSHGADAATAGTAGRGATPRRRLVVPGTDARRRRRTR